MNVYVYQAALLCEDCAKTVMLTLPKPPGYDSDDEHTWDSGYYPKGPYSDGGGEADSPQHCDHCGVFLENPLTSDGYTYVREVIEEASGSSEVINLWVEFYGIGD